MKKFSKTLRSLVALLICLVMTFSFVACNKNKDSGSGSTGNSESVNSGSESTGNSESGETPSNVSIRMQLSKTSIAYKEESVTVIVFVMGAEDDAYEVILKNVDGKPNGIDYLDIKKDELGRYSLKVKKDVPAETEVLVEAVANADKTKTASQKLTIKASGTTKVSIALSILDATDGKTRSYVRYGDDVELKVTVNTEGEKGYTLSVVNPEDDPDLAKIEDNKLIITKDVDKTKKITVTATSAANPDVKVSRTISVKPPKTAGSVDDLTSNAIANVGNLNFALKGTVADIVIENGNEDRNEYEFKTYAAAKGEKKGTIHGSVSYDFESAEWRSEWRSKKNNVVLSNTYVKGDDGNTYKKYINKDNEVASTVIKDTYGNKLTWDSQHYWNHLGDLDISQFEHNDETNEYEYKMEYGYIDVDPIMGTQVYYPSDDEYLMMYLAWSLTPMLTEQFYEFKVILDNNKEISKIVASTYPNPIYSQDNDGNNDQQIGVSYTSVEIDILALGDVVEVPQTVPYVDPTKPSHKMYFGYLQSALSDLQAKNKDNYTFKTKENSTSKPSFDPNDYAVSGGAGEEIPSTSASGTWDGKVHVKNFTSDTGESGYMGIVTKEGILINKTGEYSNGGYHTEVYGYKQNGDNTFDVFECSGGKLVGKSQKQGNISRMIPSFTVSPYVFEYSGTNVIEGTTTEVYSFALKDSIIIKDVAREFCISDCANYANGSISRSLTLNVVYNDETEKAILAGITFAYNIADNYFGYYETTFSNFGTSKLPDNLFSAENYTPRVVPTTWNDIDDVVYRETHKTKTQNGVKMKAGDVFDKVFGTNVEGKKASESIPSVKVFGSIFCDNWSTRTYWHDWFKTGNKIGTEDEYKQTIGFNVWLDDEYLDESILLIESYNEVISRFAAELAKYGFTESYSNVYLSSDKSTTRRTKGYINENAGAKGIEIKVENDGYRTFNIDFYEAGDWKK